MPVFLVVIVAMSARAETAAVQLPVVSPTAKTPPSPSDPVSRADAAAPESREDLGVAIVERGANPVIRYSVAHQHGKSWCWGYLYFSRNEISFEVKSPAQNRSHGFTYPRVNMTSAGQWKVLGTAMPGLELKFRAGGTYHFWHVWTRWVEAPPAKPTWDGVLALQDLLRAANDFSSAVDAADLVARLNTAVSGAVAAAAPVAPPRAPLTTGTIRANSPITVHCVPVTDAVAKCSAILMLDVGPGLPTGVINVVVMAGSDLFGGTGSLAQAPGTATLVVDGTGRCPLAPRATVRVYPGTAPTKQPVATTSIALTSVCQ